MTAPDLKGLGVTEADRVFRLIKAQSDFVMSEARYPAYVAAWGTGKSTAAIIKAMRMSEEYPGNLGAVFRKEFTDLNDSTMKDFEKYTGIKVNSHREAHVGNSVIMFRHLEELNNIQNINLGWFWIEQAEEIATDDPFFTLFGRLRRAGVKHCGMITANTMGKNWIYKLWKSGGLTETVRKIIESDPTAFPAGTRPEDMVALYEAKTWDNAHNLSKEFLSSLHILKEKKPVTYRRFVENSWEDVKPSSNVIIHSAWVEAARERDLNIRAPIHKIISIDVARGGSDRSVFYAIEGSRGDFRVLAKEEHDTRNTMELVGLAQLFGKKHGIISYAVDEIGVGGGPTDRLMELGFEVIPVNASHREGVPAPYFNRRAEILGNGAELMEAGRVQLLPDDDELAEQLTWAKWKPMKSSMVLQAESKDDVREEYGKSPDYADAFLNGLWALPKTRVSVKRDGYAPPPTSEHRFNPATA